MYLHRGGAIQCRVGPTMPTIKEAESFSSKDQRSQPHDTGNSSSNQGRSSASSQTYTRRMAEAFLHLLEFAEKHTYFDVACPECHSAICGDDTAIETTHESACFAESVSDDDSSAPGLNLNENGRGSSPWSDDS